MNEFTFMLGHHMNDIHVAILSVFAAETFKQISKKLVHS